MDKGNWKIFIMVGLLVALFLSALQLPLEDKLVFKIQDFVFKLQVPPRGN